MGFLKDINTLKKQAKEIDNTFDPGAQMREGKQRMAAAQEMMAQQTAAMRLATTGEDATAQVVAARDTGTQINLQPILEIDLLVMRDGQPPYPATVPSDGGPGAAGAGRRRLHGVGAGRSGEPGDRAPRYLAHGRAR